MTFLMYCVDPKDYIRTPSLFIDGVQMDLLANERAGKWWGMNKGMHNGSSMTFWMYCVDTKDHILKVSWHYLHFWLKYKNLKS